MTRKSRLKGGKIFIDNDLIWEKRRIQDKIYKWAKKYKSGGINIKIGIGKMRINGVWTNWADLEREGKMKEKKEGRERTEAECSKVTETEVENFM